MGVFGLVFMVLAAIKSLPAGGPLRSRARRWCRATLAALGGSRRGRRRLAGRDLRDRALPLAGYSQAITESQEDVARGDLQAALAKADDATGIEPYAASPYLVKALVLERLGRLEPAATAARQATKKEATNWRTWLVLRESRPRRATPRPRSTPISRAGQS